jgi:uncharacterized protein YkwD
LAYPLSGENIALAPTAELAHEGLMNSPAYRANILNPGFTRVGIAALRSGEHGLSDDETNYSPSYIMGSPGDRIMGKDRPSWSHHP